MESTVEEVNAVQRRIKVTVATDKVDTAFGHALAKLRKTARIKGFRPGKAPTSMLKKLYGESLAAEVADELIKKHLFEAIEANKIQPISAPSLEDVGLPSQGDDYSFSATVDIMPKVELGEYKSIPVQVHKHDVNDADVELELENVQKSRANRKALPPETTAAVGNVAVISHRGLVEGAEFAPLTAEKVSIELGAGQALPEIDAAVAGMNVDSSKVTKFNLPEDFPEAEIAGKEVSLDITLHELFELVVPSLDDEFAKDLGLESLAQLRDNVRSQMTAQIERGRRAEIEQGLMRHIKDKHPFEVPPTLVSSVIDDMIGQMQWPNEEQKKAALADAEMRKQVLPQAKEKAKNTLILWEVARLENIEVTDEDIDKHIEKMFGAMPEQDEEKNREMVAKMREVMGKNLKENLVFEKALDFLIDNAQVNEVVHDHT